MFLSGDSQEDTNGALNSSFFVIFFSGGFNSSFVDHILSSFQMFSHAGAPLNHSLLDIPSFLSAEDTSEGSSFHSRPVQAIWRLLSHSSYLIQPVQPLFKIVQRCVSFQWALTHRSFPRILLDSSNFSAASKILFKVWRKNGLSSVIYLSPRSFKFFQSLVQPFQFSIRSASTIVMVVLMIILNMEDWRRVSLKSWSILLKIHGSSLMLSS